MGAKNLHVLGSLNVDIMSRVTALPLPGETVQGGDLAVLLGGKGANQAVAAAQVGADVAMFGAMGEQSFGLNLRGLMAGYGVEMEGVATLSGASGAALIAVDRAGENAITVSPGANARIAEPPAVAADAVLLAQLETPPEVTLRWFAAGWDAGCLTILNAAPAVAVPDGLFDVTDILIVNETELATYSGVAIGETSSEVEILDAARALRRFAAQIIIVTLGKRGALALSADEVIHVEARKAEVLDTTGAGDCFCGVMAARLAGGGALSDALEFASAAAAISVTRQGAAPSMPTRAEVEGLLNV